jgi:hypothetical protein
MIRWTFYFDEGSVISDVKDEGEDVRIANYVDGLELFEFKAAEVEFYLNPEKLKLIARQIVSDEAQPPIEAPMQESVTV